MLLCFMLWNHVSQCNLDTKWQNPNRLNFYVLIYIKDEYSKNHPPHFQATHTFQDTIVFETISVIYGYRLVVSKQCASAEIHHYQLKAWHCEPHSLQQAMLGERVESKVNAA